MHPIFFLRSGIFIYFRFITLLAPSEAYRKNGTKSFTNGAKVYFILYYLQNIIPIETQFRRSSVLQASIRKAYQRPQEFPKIFFLSTSEPSFSMIKKCLCIEIFISNQVSTLGSSKIGGSPATPTPDRLLSR